MFDLEITEARQIVFKVDLTVYSDEVTSKVLYWLSSGYLIERKSVSSTVQRIVLTPKTDTADAPGDMKEDTERISRLFADFKVREMIRKETDGIRNILYLKAFANCSELEDLRSEE